MHSAALHRGLLARLRVIGALHLYAWVGVAITAVVIATTGINSDNFVPIFTFGSASLAVRLAVVLEYARCDDEGISWRSLFAADSAAWDDVVAVEIAARQYRVVGFGRTFRGHGVLAPCIVVTTTDEFVDRGRDEPRWRRPNRRVRRPGA